MISTIWAKHLTQAYHLQSLSETYHDETKLLTAVLVQAVCTPNRGNGETLHSDQEAIVAA